MIFKQRFRILANDVKRSCNPFKWLAFFIRRLLDKAPSVPADHSISQHEAMDCYQQLRHVDTITWLGHSTFLIKLNGRVILTDPYLTDYASPILGIGPKRFVSPGLAIEQLPSIDIIIVSHNHYDHLDKRTILALPNKANIQVVTPLNLGDFFKNCGYIHIHELNWHQSKNFDHLTIQALPAYHYSNRSIWDWNKTLWAGYSLSSSKTNRRIFFSGDTGYGALFQTMGKEQGPFDYALISIGTYQPLELLHAGHVTPQEAIQIGLAIKAKTLIAMHWGTVPLSDEPPFEPPELFYAAGLEAGYPLQNLWVLKIGETRQL